MSDFSWIIDDGEEVSDIKKDTLIVFKATAWSIHWPHPQIRVRQAGLIYHKLHALSQVVLERCSWNLQPVEGSNNDWHIPFIQSELRSKYSIHLFSAWHFYVSVHDFISLEAHVVQSRHHQSNPQGITGKDTCVCNCWWQKSHVTPRNDPCLAS